MVLLYFVIGVIVGALLLIVLPLFIAVLGVALAVGVIIALPPILAVLMLIGFVAVAPALGWGPLLAAILIALWSSDRKRAPAMLTAQPLSSEGSCKVVSCPRTGSASASSRLRPPFHSAAGRTAPSLPIWSMPQ